MWGESHRDRQLKLIARQMLVRAASFHCKYQCFLLIEPDGMAFRAYSWLMKEADPEKKTGKIVDPGCNQRYFTP